MIIVSVQYFKKGKNGINVKFQIWYGQDELIAYEQTVLLVQAHLALTSLEILGDQVQSQSDPSFIFIISINWQLIYDMVHVVYGTFIL